MSDTSLWDDANSGRWVNGVTASGIAYWNIERITMKINTSPCTAAIIISPDMPGVKFVGNDKRGLLSIQCSRVEISCNRLDEHSIYGEHVFSGDGFEIRWTIPEDTVFLASI